MFQRLEGGIKSVIFTEIIGFWNQKLSKHKNYGKTIVRIVFFQKIAYNGTDNMTSLAVRDD